MQAVSGVGKIPGREEMVARAAALTPRLAERAGEVERTREIHPDTVEDFWDTRLWSILKPRRYGGLELDYGTVIDFPSGDFDKRSRFREKLLPTTRVAGSGPASSRAAAVRMLRSACSLAP